MSEPAKGPAQKTKMFLWKQVSVVGINHHDLKGDLTGIRPGMRLVLGREPQNSNDANAVLVIEPVTGFSVGYIPKSDLGQVARFLDNGFDVFAYVQTSDHTRTTLHINLWLKGQS